MVSALRETLLSIEYVFFGNEESGKIRDRLIKDEKRKF